MFCRITRHPLALACCLLLPAMAHAASWQGQVSRVTDGDTLTVADGQHSVVIRVAEIDAPESAQAWGKQARRALADLVTDQTATVDEVDTDKYGRTARISPWAAWTSARCWCDTAMLGNSLATAMMPTWPSCRRKPKRIMPGFGHSPAPLRPGTTVIPSSW